ncbi:PleD family two-component system response regulator [Pseudoalteromonas sp. MTN2-4]|uniref:response regulator n=1 Tax=Pseudoalteromonas sp. MTN2-4 TaxID=3056555 RepID=UPI0036F1C7DA
MAKSEQPDVILLDVEMPGQNGYECCEVLKSDNTTKEIPIVFLSGKTTLESVCWAMRPVLMIINSSLLIPLNSLPN